MSSFRYVFLLVITVVVVACGGAGPAPSPSPIATLPPTPAATPQPIPGVTPSPAPISQIPTRAFETIPLATSTPTPGFIPTPTSTPATTPLPPIITTATPVPVPITQPAFFLKVTSPQNEAVLSTASLQVSGQTTSDAVVTVNGQIVELDTDGQFAISIRLVEGPNVIEVLASDFAGHRAQEVRSVIYVP